MSVDACAIPRLEFGNQEHINAVRAYEDRLDASKVKPFRVTLNVTAFTRRSRATPGGNPRAFSLQGDDEMASFFKQERIEDKAMRDRVAREGCAIWFAGACWGRVVSHHLKTRGSGGDDRQENLLPLCAKHHRHIHDVGTSAFGKAYWPGLSIRNRIKIAVRVHGIKPEEARARYAGARRFE